MKVVVLAVTLANYAAHSATFGEN